MTEPIDPHDTVPEDCPHGLWARVCGTCQATPAEPWRRNDYRPGSLLWIERQAAIEVRAILARMIAGESTAEEAREALWCLDSDSASS